MGNNLHSGHRKRVKDRYLAEGLDSFADHQVLELLLFYCVPMRDTNEMAHKILAEFGSLAKVFEADPRDICRRCKVSEHVAILLSLIAPMAKRYLVAKQGAKKVLSSSKDAGNFAISLFVGHQYEVFYVICLDTQNRVNNAVLVHEGTINETPVYPRIIVETALRHQANSVILAHNHPGGSLQPSNADLQITKRLTTALEAISVSVVDHIIVAGDKYFSFAENGLI